MDLEANTGPRFFKQMHMGTFLVRVGRTDGYKVAPPARVMLVAERFEVV